MRKIIVGALIIGALVLMLPALQTVSLKPSRVTSAIATPGTHMLVRRTPPISSASRHHLTRINQLDPAQYDSPQQYKEWAYSTCSTAAMAEILNYYGGHYRIADVLRVQVRVGEITPDLGLLEPAGIARTMAAAPFHYQTDNSSHTLDQIIALANSGTPVIIGVPPSAIPGGHLMVVSGGNATTVRLADSSRINRPLLSRTAFLSLWSGYVAIVTPVAGKAVQA